MLACARSQARCNSCCARCSRRPHPTHPVPCSAAGVDVAALLAKIGLQPNDTSETVGTFAIAYAAHKALSPVRFPPTVALTPIVAKYIGSKTNAAAGSGEQQNKDGQ